MSVKQNGALLLEMVSLAWVAGDGGAAEATPQMHVRGVPRALLLQHPRRPRRANTLISMSPRVRGSLPGGGEATGRASARGPAEEESRRAKEHPEGIPNTI